MHHGRRFRGEESGYAPWLALLPHAFSTPLFYTPDELDELRGTTLYQATLCVAVLCMTLSITASRQLETASSEACST